MYALQGVEAGEEVLAMVDFTKDPITKSFAPTHALRKTMEDWREKVKTHTSSQQLSIRPLTREKTQVEDSPYRSAPAMTADLTHALLSCLDRLPSPSESEEVQTEAAQKYVRVFAGIKPLWD